MAVLVTGGAGYIGSHMVQALLDNNENVVVIDDLSTGVRSAVNQDASFVFGSVADEQLVAQTIQDHQVDAVIHFAGSVVVPESVENPTLYYSNNTAASLSLVKVCIKFGIGHFVFSSTAAVYGSPDITIVTEDSPKNPINPYGRSKLMVENILADTSAAHPFRYHALRYFNVAGADPEGRRGQSTPRATHLIKRASEVALGKRACLDIFGTDFPTPDGTGVRDYIHVSDLVNAHVLALAALRDGALSAVYNCGYGRGLSVRDIICAVEKDTGKPLPTRDMPRRPGDPAMLIADSTRLQTRLGWRPQYADIASIVGSALGWEAKIGQDSIR
jgi:UDP-glucose 4-epimerase